MQEIIKKEKPEILGSPFMPQGFEGKLQLAEVLYQSGLCPKDMDSKEKVFVALQYGHELGLSPMIAVQNIAVINKRPSLSTIIMKGISFSSGKLEYFETSEILGENNEILGYKTKGKRKDYPDEFNSSFTFEEAHKAGLYDKNMSVWLKYEHDMCRNRSESRFFKAAFAELFAGLLTKDEARELDPIDVTPEKETDKLLDKIKDDLDKEIDNDEGIKIENLTNNENEETGSIVIDGSCKMKKEVYPGKKFDNNERKKRTSKKIEKEKNIIDATGIELNEDGSKKSEKEDDYNPVEAFNIIFGNDRARKIKHLMNDKDKSHFADVARKLSEYPKSYPELHFKKDLEIIENYEKQLKEYCRKKIYNTGKANE